MRIFSEFSSRLTPRDAKKVPSEGWLELKVA